MTKCNIVGEHCFSKDKYPVTKQKENIKFEFKVSVLTGISIEDDCPDPDVYDNITLVCKNYVNFMEKNYDLMYAYDSLTCGDGPSRGCLYVGYWNNGTV
jgi:hypothetical protein